MRLTKKSPTLVRCFRLKIFPDTATFTVRSMEDPATPSMHVDASDMAPLSHVCTLLRCQLKSGVPGLPISRISAADFFNKSSPLSMVWTQSNRAPAEGFTAGWAWRKLDDDVAYPRATYMETLASLRGLRLTAAANGVKVLVHSEG